MNILQVGPNSVHVSSFIAAMAIQGIQQDLLTEEAVARFCHENLTGYKRPKYIEFRDELPKSNVGKILRRELRDVKPAA